MPDPRPLARLRPDAPAPDALELAERRAHRAELAEQAQARRAEQAEQHARALEAERLELERRLSRSLAELERSREAFGQRLADRTRSAQAAAQRAEAERRRAETGEDRAHARLEAAGSETAAARAQVRSLREDLLDLEAQAEHLRRGEAEARQDAAIARSQRSRLHELDARREHESLMTRLHEEELVREAAVAELVARLADERQRHEQGLALLRRQIGVLQSQLETRAEPVAPPPERRPNRRGWVARLLGR